MATEKQNPGFGELIRLSEVEYETEADQPDLIGWSVIDADSAALGILDDMLVDVQTGAIPFGSICYDDRCKIVPLELVFLDESNEQLVLPVTKQELDDAPNFSDETDNLQPHIDFWNRMVSRWQAEMSEDELEEVEMVEVEEVIEEEPLD